MAIHEGEEVMGITAEQRLSICKFLAEKIWKKAFQNYKPFTGTPVVYVNGKEFNPFTNPAQRMEVIEAAWARYDEIIVGCSMIWCSHETHTSYTTHDNTPESRNEAVLVAIAKAWGWREI